MSSTSKFVQTYAPAGFPAATPEAGRVTLQAPDQIRFDYDGPEGKLFTFDGKAARQFVAADRQMIVKTLRPEERERLPLLFLESPETVLRRYTVTAADAGNGLVESADPGDPARRPERAYCGSEGDPSIQVPTPERQPTARSPGGTRRSLVRARVRAGRRPGRRRRPSAPKSG